MTTSPLRRWLAPTAVFTLALLFACLKGTAPTDASANDVRFDLSAQVTGGSTLHITVVYLDQGTSVGVSVPVMLLDQRITVAAGTQSLPLTIDITRCLADPRHIAGSTCELFAGVTLEQNGTVIDSVSVGPVTVTPGQLVRANTTLTPIGKVVVYPKPDTITVGSTVQLHDSVYSPTSTVLTGVAVTWTSGNTGVATVDTSGLVHGVGAGNATIYATAGGHQDSAIVTVNAVVTGGQISITPATVLFTAPSGGTIPLAGFPRVTAFPDTTKVVSNLVSTITPSSATAWLAANVSDSLLGSAVTKLPSGIRAQRIRLATSGSGVTTPATIDIHPTTTSMPAGTYTATVTITGSGGASAALSVSYTITAVTPTLALSPNTVAFNQYAYGSTVAAAQITTATNSGSGTLGQVSESGPIVYPGADTGWLSVSVSGTTITVQPKKDSLSIGTDTAKVPFNAVGAVNNPQILTVTASQFVTYSKVVLGAAFGCGLTTASTVYCWGGDGQGELGDGGADLGVLIPVRAKIPYSPTNPVIDIEAGSFHACALQQSGAVYCWGANTKGQIGNGTTVSPVSTPTLISGHTYGMITLGALHTCGVEGTPPATTNNYVDCWGDNTYGEFGNNSTASSSSPTNTGNFYYYLSAGNGYTCGISSTTNTLACWGLDNFGQLGNGYSAGTYPSPQGVSIGAAAPAVITSVSAGNQTTCALTNAGAAWCWGDNTYGELGDTTVGTPNPFPAGIFGTTFTSISVGYYSVCGIASTGAYCWGENNYGQLGNGTTTNQSGPTFITGGSGTLYTQLVVGQGSQSACGITGGVVSCFGFDSNGQLGTGAAATTTVSTPTAMFGQPAPSGVGPSRVTKRPTVRLQVRK